MQTILATPSAWAASMSAWIASRFRSRPAICKSRLDAPVGQQVRDRDGRHRHSRRGRIGEVEGGDQVLQRFADIEQIAEVGALGRIQFRRKGEGVVGQRVRKIAHARSRKRQKVLRPARCNGVYRRLYGTVLVSCPFQGKAVRSIEEDTPCTSAF